MDPDILDQITDAFLAASARGEMPTNLDTEGLRELSAELRARSVFTARGTNAIFVSKIKEVIDLLTAGDIGEADARLGLIETLRAVGYTPEGGFPDDPPGTVPPAVAGTLQDLSSFRRLDLIVRTQMDLMQGAGDQMRGATPERLAAAPAWELIRAIPSEIPRDWPTRFAIAGGTMIRGRMVAFKGDPVWGELGSSGNFRDALDVDHPPFAFNSGMRWREILRPEVEALGVRGPNGESIDEWLASRPMTIAGQMPLPTPRVSMAGVDPDLRREFEAATRAVPVPGKPDLLEPGDDFYDDEMSLEEIREAERRRRAAGRGQA